MRPASPAQQPPQLGAVLGALVDDALPADLVGLPDIVLADGAVELDDLDARRLLLLDLFLVKLQILVHQALDPCGLLVEIGALRVVELLPGVEVDEDADLGAVEAGIDAVLGLLLPAQIEDAGDRPAIA